MASKMARKLLQKGTPKPLNGHQSVTINSKLVMLMSIPMVFRGKELDIFKTIKMMLAHYITM